MSRNLDGLHCTGRIVDDIRWFVAHRTRARKDTSTRAGSKEGLDAGTAMTRRQHGPVVRNMDNSRVTRGSGKPPHRG